MHVVYLSGKANLNTYHRYFDCTINNMYSSPRVVLLLLTLKRIIQEDRKEDM